MKSNVHFDSAFIAVLILLGLMYSVYQGAFQASTLFVAMCILIVFLILRFSYSEDRKKEQFHSHQKHLESQIEKILKENKLTHDVLVKQLEGILQETKKTKIQLTNQIEKIIAENKTSESLLIKQLEKLLAENKTSESLLTNQIEKVLAENRSSEALLASHIENLGTGILEQQKRLENTGIENQKVLKNRMSQLAINLDSHTRILDENNTLLHKDIIGLLSFQKRVLSKSENLESLIQALDLSNAKRNEEVLVDIRDLFIILDQTNLNNKEQLNALSENLKIQINKIKGEAKDEELRNKLLGLILAKFKTVENYLKTIEKRNIDLLSDTLISEDSLLAVMNEEFEQLQKGIILLEKKAEERAE